MSRYRAVIELLPRLSEIRQPSPSRLSTALLRGCGECSAADTAPLRRVIARYVDADMIAKIATEHRKGRRLFIGTTNLDAGRPVLWNLGAIANSLDPGAADLIHDVLLASASIPGAFLPVLINVRAEGETFDELHVDGGTTTHRCFCIRKV